VTRIDHCQPKLASPHMTFFKLFELELEKCQDSEYIKFGAPMYFYICPFFGPKSTFQLYSCTFTSKFGNFIYILDRSGKIYGKKIKAIFIWQKINIHFEMVQNSPIVPPEGALDECKELYSSCWQVFGIAK